MNLLINKISHAILSSGLDLSKWNELPDEVLYILLVLGTVFAILILIAGLVVIFKTFFKLIMGKKEDFSSNQNISTNPNIDSNIDLMQDTQLVAVITAAVMAYMGDEVPEDGFVVRSIRRK